MVILSIIILLDMPRYLFSFRIPIRVDSGDPAETVPEGHITWLGAQASEGRRTPWGRGGTRHLRRPRTKKAPGLLAPPHRTGRRRLATWHQLWSRGSAATAHLPRGHADPGRP